MEQMVREYSLFPFLTIHLTINYMKTNLLLYSFGSYAMGILMAVLIFKDLSIRDAPELYLMFAACLIITGLLQSTLQSFINKHTQKRLVKVDKGDGYQYMQKGFKIRHESWNENMYIWMPYWKEIDFRIFDESNYAIFDYLSYKAPGQWILLK